MKLSSNDIKNTLIARSKHLIQLSKNNDGIAVLDEAEFLINLAENIKLFYCHDGSEGKRCEKQCDYCVGFEGYTANPNEKGAEYEHKYQREQQAELRNKVIEECIDIVDQPWQTTDADAIVNHIIDRLNSLKTK